MNAVSRAMQALPTKVSLQDRKRKFHISRLILDDCCDFLSQGKVSCDLVRTKFFCYLSQFLRNSLACVALWETLHLQNTCKELPLCSELMCCNCDVYLGCFARPDIGRQHNQKSCLNLLTKQLFANFMLSADHARYQLATRDNALGMPPSL